MHRERERVTAMSYYSRLGAIEPQINSFVVGIQEYVPYLFTIAPFVSSPIQNQIPCETRTGIRWQRTFTVDLGWIRLHHIWMCNACGRHLLRLVGSLTYLGGGRLRAGATPLSFDLAQLRPFKHRLWRRQDFLFDRFPRVRFYLFVTRQLPEKGTKRMYLQFEVCSGDRSRPFFLYLNGWQMIV